MLVKAEDVSKVVKWCIDNKAYFDPELFIETLDECIKSDTNPLSAEEIEETNRTFAFLQSLTEKHAELIMSPSPFSIKIIFDEIVKLANVFGSEIMEPVVLLKKINEVPGIAGRVINIRPIAVKKRPNSLVYYYYNQCINCYIHGLIEASAVMARSVLDYSLREVLKTNKTAYIRFVKSDDSLESLIATCGEHNILTGELIKKADNVRRKGNAAIHKRKINEQEILHQIEQLGDILEHIY